MEKKAGETLGKPEWSHGILPALHTHILAFLNLHVKVKTQIHKLLETVHKRERESQTTQYRKNLVRTHELYILNT